MQEMLEEVTEVQTARVRLAMASAAVVFGIILVVLVVRACSRMESSRRCAYL